MNSRGFFSHTVYYIRTHTRRQGALKRSEIRGQNSNLLFLNSGLRLCRIAKSRDLAYILLSLLRQHCPPIGAVSAATSDGRFRRPVGGQWQCLTRNYAWAWAYCSQPSP